MTFTIRVSRDVIGNAISIIIDAEAGRRIARVRTELDGFLLGEDDVNPAATHFERTFRQAGSAGPGMEHTLVVEAFDGDGGSDVATKIWVDQS